MIGKIDIFHNILWPKYKGQIFTMLEELASTQKQVEISFFQIAKTTSDRKALNEVDLSYHRYPFRLLFDDAYEAIPKFTLCATLFRLVLRSKADLIVLPGYHLIEFWFMLLACVLTGKKRAVFVDSTRFDQPVSKIKDMLKRVFFRLCDGFFCYGFRSREYLLELGVPSHKIVIGCQAAALPHGYRPEEALSSRLQRLQPREGRSAPSYLFVGRLVPEKSLDILMEAFERVYRQDPAATLTLVGSGPLSGEMNAMARSRGLQQAVRFTGAVDIDQLQNYFLDSTCLVLPSRSEAWGLVVNEALSYGCPVVVSNQCGCAPELVIDGKTGYLFQVGDTDDLYRKMLLAAREMSNAPTVAKDCIELMQSYTPAKAAAKILEGCRSILSGPAANSVFFVGPLPPPLHGFSAINQKMLAHLADTPDVRSFNTVPRLRSSGSPLSAASKAFSRVRSFCSYFFQALARRPSVLYIGLSGGLGQIFDSLYILTARLAGAEVFVHHHSFVYLNSVRPHNRLCMRLAGPASHIVLCDVMARKLAAVYGVPAERISVLSNAAFLDEGKTELPSFGRVHRQDGLTLGFIANITLEKGIVEFFEVVARLVQQGHPVKALVAGPVDPDMQKIFFSMLDNQPAVNYLGPVYGEEKETFFKNIDLLLFPTKYPNEAEPLIILEALRAAVPVIAAGRGCINSLINQQSGVVFPNIDDYVDNATEYVKAVITGEIPLSVLSENAFNQFSAMRIKNMACINALLARIKRRSLPQPAAKTNLHEI